MASPGPLRVTVVGAGVVGCYLGGRLAATASVTLLGREHVLDPVRSLGLTVESRDGDRTHVPASVLTLATEPSAVADADVVLVCTKAAATAAATRGIRPHLRPGVPVVGLQNGLHSADLIREGLDDNPVLAGMVPFNVARTGPATYRRTSAGRLVVERRPETTRLVHAARRAGMTVHTSADMPAVLHGKVLLNLNNAIQALSGLPLRTELLDRDLRRCLALCQVEANRCFTAAGIVPEVPVAVPAAALPTVLRMPTPAFRVLAQATLQVDADGTSSMADDLARGRATEVDVLQGEVVDIGRRTGVPTPVCARVAELVHEAERDAARGAFTPWRGRELLAELRRARAAGYSS